MGIFDFLRKSKTLVEDKKIELNELEQVLLEKKEILKNQEAPALNLLLNVIKNLNLDLDKSLEEISSINIDERKVEERFKLVVKNNLERYLVHLSSLNKSLADLKSTSLQDLISKSNNLLNDFEKKSFMNFEKSTILVGKELEAVVENIKKFYTAGKEIQKNNQELLESLFKINEAEKTLHLYNEQKAIEKTLSKELNLIQDKLVKQENLLKNLRIKKEELLESESYKSFLEKKSALEKKKSNLDSELLRLKDLVDLKDLAKTFHSNEKKMKILKEYRENFKLAFISDKGKSLLEMSENESIKNQLEKIYSIESEVSAFSIDKDEIYEINSEIKEVESQIQDLKQEQSKKERKISQIDELLEMIKSNLSKEVTKLGLELI